MGATIPNINSSITDNVNNSMFINAQSLNTPSYTTNTLPQNPNMSNNLFDTIQPQVLNNQQSLNNNTGIIKKNCDDIELLFINIFIY